MHLYLTFAGPEKTFTPKEQHRMVWISLLRLLEEYAGNDQKGVELCTKKLLEMDDPAPSISEKWGIVHEKKGKPVFAGKGDMFFNLSHCAYCTAAAVHDAPVGVDVERNFKWNRPLAKRISTPEELAYLEQIQDEEKRGLELNRLWCRKESVIKCSGEGLGAELSSVPVLHMPGFREYQDRQITLCTYANAT